MFRMDINLAPYGASLHCSISHMIVATNPEEVPTHQWTRVLRRLGIFADVDEHAERIINVGLSFAYRHLEMDALVGASAALLGKRRLSTGLGRGFHDGGEENASNGAVPKGGIVIPPGDRT